MGWGFNSFGTMSLLPYGGYFVRHLTNTVVSVFLGCWRLALWDGLGFDSFGTKCCNLQYTGIWGF